MDWENNLFENKVLRFKDAIVYLKKEIPFLGQPAILEIKQLHSHKHTYNGANGTIESAKHKIEMVTNAGSRFVEFNEAELLDARIKPDAANRIGKIAADVLIFGDKTTINGSKEMKQQFSKLRYFTNPLPVVRHH